MNRQQAAALVIYLNRAIGIIPTTGMEWDVIRSALPMIEGIANGQVQCSISSIEQPLSAAPTAPAETPPQA